MVKRKVYDVKPAPADRPGLPDLTSMSRADLEALRHAIEADMASIRLQVERAAASFRQSGVPSDARWLTSARYALRMKGVEAQQIQRAIGAAGRAEKAAKVLTPDENAIQRHAFLRGYMRAARSLMSEAQHADCVAEAQAEADAALAAHRVSP